MVLNINNKEEDYSYLKVEASFYNLMRTFVLRSNDNKQEFEIGSSILIENEKEEIIFDGVVESVLLERGSKFAYSGRDNMRTLADSFFDKNIQFTKNQNIKSIFNTALSGLNIEIKNTIQTPRNCDFQAMAGTKIVEFLNTIAYISGVQYHSHNDSLVIGNESNDAVINLEYSSDIYDREVVQDRSRIYNEYIIYANNNSYKIGNGLKKYVENLPFNLFRSDCEIIAKHRKNLNNLSNLHYQCEIDYNISMGINDTVYVRGDLLDFFFPFRCVGLIYERGYDLERKTIKLEKLYGSENEQIN